MSHNAEEVAQAVGEYLAETDRKFLDLLGISIDEVCPGRAVCSMTVREDMLNSGQFCHGGFIFFLADNAFAYACLSDNRSMVTLSAHVVFTQGGRLGDRLTATAQVVTESGRTGTCDVEIVNQDGTVVARYQGICYRRKENVIMNNKL